MLSVVNSVNAAIVSALLISTAGLKYRSQVIVLQIQKVSQTLVKANLRPNDNDNDDDNDNDNDNVYSAHIVVYI